MKEVFCNTGVLIRTSDSCRELRLDVLSRHSNPSRLSFEWKSTDEHSEVSSTVLLSPMKRPYGCDQMERLAERLGGQSLFHGTYVIELPQCNGRISWYRFVWSLELNDLSERGGSASFTRQGVAAQRILTDGYDHGFPLRPVDTERRLDELDRVFGHSNSEVSYDAMHELWSKLYAGEDTPALDKQLSLNDPEQRRFVFGLRKNIRRRHRRSRFSLATGRLKAADPFQSAITIGGSESAMESTDTSQRAYQALIVRLLIRDFTLNDQSIEVIERRLFRGQTYEEIASSLSMKAVSARSIVCRFRQFLG